MLLLGTGYWCFPESREPRFAVRNMNGSVDELVLFGAELSSEEIGRIYDHGKP